MDRNRSFDKINNVFGGGIAFIGICITVATLFQVTDKAAKSYVDDSFVITSVVYLLAVVLAFFSEGRTLEKLSSYVFTTGLVFTIGSVIVLLIEHINHA